MSVAIDESRAWKAVVNRDTNSDGDFVYAVRSTGIYCRPSCPSRKPGSPEAVRFFPEPVEAMRAGFRACKRCRPNEADRNLTMVENVCRYLDELVYQPGDYEMPTLDELGQRFSYSPGHLQRVFKQVAGVTPFEYAETRRWERLQQSLDRASDVTTAIYDAGFSSPSRVYERAYDQLGMTPWAYLKRGAGQRIRYTVAQTPIGWLLVATTDKGICSVQFGESPADLAENLASTFAESSIQLSPVLDQTVQQILDQLSGKQPSVDLPLDIQATAFQRAVWNELQKIPAGETRTYGQVAAAIGDSKKARAVGNACSENPVALIIPCHRVVPANGDTGAYRWGADRKLWLLEQESRTGS